MGLCEQFTSYRKSYSGFFFSETVYTKLRSTCCGMCTHEIHRSRRYADWWVCVGWRQHARSELYPEATGRWVIQEKRRCCGVNEIFSAHVIWTLSVVFLGTTCRRLWRSLTICCSRLVRNKFPPMLLEITTIRSDMSVVFKNCNPVALYKEYNNFVIAVRFP